MRQNYYDRKDQEDPPKTGRPVPEPYGAVPEPLSSGFIRTLPTPSAPQESAEGDGACEESPRRTPNVWAGKPRRRQAGRGKNFGKFSFFLALILILTGVGVYLQGGVMFPTLTVSSIDELWDRLDPRSGDYYEEEDWLEELKDTTVERFPNGDGTVLTLVPAEGGRLEPGEIYDKVSPAVVGVRAMLKNGIALGTGVVMSEDGYIITNAHVIAGASRLVVTLSDDIDYKALLVGYDGDSDLAVLKIKAEGLVTAEFGDSSALRVGDTAYAIGNPLGEELRGTMTDGIISAIDRNVDMDGQEMTLLQTTAALNSGNSGGALVNTSGQVVGVTNMKMMSDWETIEGLGFAIPSLQAKEVVDQLIAQGSYPGRPALGITVQNQSATGEIPAGTYVAHVERKSDAYAQGIRTGDVIVEAGGAPVTSIKDLEKAKEGLGVGDELVLRVWNQRGERILTVKLVGRNELN